MSKLRNISELLETCSKINSRNEKLKLLQEAIKNNEQEELLRTIFKWAFDPDILFGIRKLSVTSKDSDKYEESLEPIKKLLKEHKDFKTKEAKKKLVSVLEAYEPIVVKYLIQALLKNMTTGVGPETVNKLFPGLIFWFSCMLADPSPSEFEEEHFPSFVEPKIDGIRAFFFVDKLGNVRALSRKGKPLYNVDEFKKILIEIQKKNFPEGVIFDGELYSTSCNDTWSIISRSDSGATLEELKSLRFYVFDILTTKEFSESKSSLTQLERSKRVLDYFPTASINDFADLAKLREKIYTVCDLSNKITWNNRTELDRIYKQALDIGLEGLVLKKADGLYEFGRSSNWLKYKPVQTGDFQIINVAEGLGKNTGKLGGLIINIDGLECNVGSGFSDKQRMEFWNNPPIGKIAEIEYKCRSADNILREPIFVKIREDKLEE